MERYIVSVHRPSSCGRRLRRIYFSCSLRTPARRRRRLVLRAVYRCKYGVMQFHPTAFMDGLSSRRRTRRRRLPGQFEGERFWSVTRPARGTSHHATSSPGHDSGIREGGVGPKKDHIYLHLDHLDAAMLHNGCCISESARVFSGVD